MEGSDATERDKAVAEFRLVDDVRALPALREVFSDADDELLLEAIFQRYGYDFRSYARASLARRVRLFRDRIKARAVSELIPLILHDEQVFSNLVQGLSVNVTGMFRDPPVFRVLREQVMPVLKSHPFVTRLLQGGETVEYSAQTVHRGGFHLIPQVFGEGYGSIL